MGPPALVHRKSISNCSSRLIPSSPPCCQKRPSCGSAPKRGSRSLASDEEQSGHVNPSVGHGHSLDDHGPFPHQPFHEVLQFRVGVPLNRHVSHGNSCPLDHRTTTSGTSMRCSLGSVAINERVSPGRLCRSPVRRQPEHERFHTEPCPWKGPAWYVTEHWTGSDGSGEL